MASTKSATAVWSGQTLTAGAGDTTSSAVDLTDGYGATASVKLTNGATGPTVPARVEIQTSEDNSEWYTFGGVLVGLTSNSAVISWGGIEIPMHTRYVRFIAGSNTAQDVTVDLDVSETTAIS